MEFLFDLFDHLKNLFGIRSRPVKVVQKYD